MKAVYLCGGINGLTDADAKGWREFATDALTDKFRVLDPMRRDYRGVEDQSVGAIVRGDLADVVEADVVLANCARPSWGTAMEVFFAFSIGRPVFAVVGDGPVSPWVRHHSTHVVRSLPEALSLIRETWGR